MTDDVFRFIPLSENALILAFGKSNSHSTQVCYFRCSTHINIELAGKITRCVSLDGLSFLASNIVFIAFLLLLTMIAR